MKTPWPILTIILAFQLAAAVAPAFPDEAGKGSAVLVTGKLVYSGMGIEDAEVVAISGGKPMAKTKSGYHGSFLLRLAPGIYELSSETVLANGRVVSGSIEHLAVPRSISRIDRLVLLLTPR